MTTRELRARITIDRRQAEQAFAILEGDAIRLETAMAATTQEALRLGRALQDARVDVAVEADLSRVRSAIDSLADDVVPVRVDAEIDAAAVQAELDINADRTQASVDDLGASAEDAARMGQRLEAGLRATDQAADRLDAGLRGAASGADRMESAADSAASGIDELGDAALGAAGGFVGAAPILGAIEAANVALERRTQQIEFGFATIQDIERIQREAGRIGLEPQDLINTIGTIARDVAAEFAAANESPDRREELEELFRTFSIDPTIIERFGQVGGRLEQSILILTELERVRNTRGVNEFRAAARTFGIEGTEADFFTALESLGIEVEDLADRLRNGAALTDEQYESLQQVTGATTELSAQMTGLFATLADSGIADFVSGLADGTAAVAGFVERLNATDIGRSIVSAVTGGLVGAGGAGAIAGAGRLVGARLPVARTALVGAGLGAAALGGASFFGGDDEDAPGFGSERGLARRARDVTIQQNIYGSATDQQVRSAQDFAKAALDAEGAR